MGNFMMHKYSAIYNRCEGVNAKERVEYKAPENE